MANKNSTANLQHEVNGVAIEQRSADGFINATAMCVSHEKELRDWFRIENTLELFYVLAEEEGIISKVGARPTLQNPDISRVSIKDYLVVFSDLMILKLGSPKKGGGVWLHPDLAVSLAQWLSPKFTLQVSKWVRQWLTTGQNPIAKPEPIAPYWYKRMFLAMSDIEKPLQAGYFCIYVEMMNFFRDLEMHLNYVVKDLNPETEEYIVPDISIAKCFNNWLREKSEAPARIRKQFLNSEEIIDFRDAYKEREVGTHRHEILTYNHTYPEESHGEDNVCEANSYPNKYKIIFHHYLEEIYIPTKCFPYLKERDPQGIEEVRQLISLMPEKTKAAFSKTLVGKFTQGLLPAATKTKQKKAA